MLNRFCNTDIDLTLFCITFTALFSQICLLDFGASRSYDKKFVDKYIKVRLFFLSSRNRTRFVETKKISLVGNTNMASQKYCNLRG